MAEIKKAHPDKPVEVWAFDEHRLGLKPVVRRVWAPKGQRPLARARPRYQWLYLYAYVQPQRGEVEWLIGNTVNSELMNESLKLFAKSVGAADQRIILLVMDGAGWHHPSALKIPKGIYVEYLPPYSPELQPAERLWPLTDEAIANQTFDDLDDLENKLQERCLQLDSQTDLVTKHTNFDWWPEPLS